MILIGHIYLYETHIPIFYSKQVSNKQVICSWGVRNNDKKYEGVMYIDHETGKLSYPTDAIIPRRTAEDNEIIPKFFITCMPKYTKDLHKSIEQYIINRCQRKRNT